MHTNTQFALAVHILALLAQGEGEVLTSERLAGSVNTNPVFIRRILGQLHRAALVGSQPGVGGGWRLLRPPGAITLLDVYQAVESGHLLALHRSQPNQQCPVGRNIGQVLRAAIGEAERAFEQSLAQQTVAQALDAALAIARAEAS